MFGLQKSTVKTTTPIPLGVIIVYMRKCLKPIRYFVNRMLEVFRNVQNPSKILLNDVLVWDLKWLQTF